MTSSKIRYTRQHLECPLIGVPADFKSNLLPSKGDVLKCYLWTRYNLKPPNSGKEPTVFEISNVLSDKVLSLWQKASIPTITRKRVLQLIKTHHDKYLKLLRYPEVKKNNSYKIRVQEFQAENTRLFDISACKCEIFEQCSCDKEKKVPKNEWGFLLDQRGPRKMIIGNTDVKETSKLINKARRMEKDMQRKELQQSVQHERNIDLSRKRKPETDIEMDPELPSTSYGSINTEMQCTQNYNKLPTLAKVCDRYGLSDRSAAAVATAVLHDLGIVSTDNTKNVIDRSKLRRAREQSRKGFIHNSTETLKAIYFDGRKDKTLVIENIEGTPHRRTILEEHISLVQEPGSIFLGHTVPLSGSALSICQSIVNFLESYKYNLEELVVVGCDGTVVNTGRKNGAISQLELKLGRPLQRFICQLHANELPLRHLFQKLDGQTTGPKGFAGTIGNQIQQCENMPVVNYNIINCELPEVDFLDLSADQKYLFQICVAVSTGECSVDLLNRSPGKLSHSRWLTLANRILRLYVSTENPTSELKELTKFIVKVYAPLWFQIKCNSSCVNGAKHVLQTIKRSRYLEQDLKSVIDPVIQRNACFVHPENLLICMLHDTRPHIRELALRRILNTKTKGDSSTNIRPFIIPQINFDADDYVGLIDWQNNKITCPPLLQTLEVDDLKNIISDSPGKIIDIAAFPCHTQSVERCVKLVTEASLSVVGSQKRDSFIKAKIDSRKLMPKFESKKDYKQ